MNKLSVTIWNREFDLDVSYSCYPGETITDVQKLAARDFPKYEDNISSSLKEVKAYVEATNDNDLKATDMDNIFKCVMPKTIFIPRTEEKVVAILCDYKFDMENGIAIVFEDGKLKTIGTQDIIL